MERGTEGDEASEDARAWRRIMTRYKSLLAVAVL
jgi:hypothetical protein